MTLPAAPKQSDVSPEDLCNRARALLQKGEHIAAEERLQEALADDPDYAPALSLMADIYIGRGDQPRAVGYALRAMNADSGNGEHKKKFLHLAGNVIYKRYYPALEAAILACLETPGVEFEFAPMLWVSTLLAMPFFGPLFWKIHWRGFLRKKFLPWLKNPFDAVRDFRPLLYPYFLLGLRKMVVPSSPFENFMVFLRAFLLEQMESSHPKFTAAEYLELVVSVAYYGFRSDYILDVTEREQGKINELRARIESGNDAQEAASVALLACYVPLYSLRNADAIARYFADKPLMAGLLREQVGEYAELQSRAEAVVALTPVEDTVSEKVKAQYEVFPYPRWRELGSVYFDPADKHTALLSRSDAAVLIAGCGTGMESCQLAAAFPGLDILAVDITRASLAYAMQRAEKYGLRNIAYRQADILKLNELDRTFDYIQSFGVLHHMGDPEKGLATLANLLKPGGLMLIGLYSEMARRPVVEAHAAIAKGNYAATPEGMRRFRKDSPKLLSRKSMAVLTRSSDYYSLNMYRDLLFHAHEERFDIPRIKSALGKAGLVFKGFKLPPGTWMQYRQTFPNDPEGLNLDNWRVFEQAHPQTFWSCYAIFCGKAAGEPGQGLAIG